MSSVGVLTVSHTLPGLEGRRQGRLGCKIFICYCQSLSFLWEAPFVLSAETRRLMLTLSFFAQLCFIMGIIYYCIDMFTCCQLKYVAVTVKTTLFKSVTSKVAVFTSLCLLFLLLLCSCCRSRSNQQASNWHRAKELFLIPEKFYLSFHAHVCTKGDLINISFLSFSWRAWYLNGFSNEKLVFTVEVAKPREEHFWYCTV